MNGLIRRSATGRNVIVAFVLVIALVQVFNLLLFPAYRAASSGFDPMDVQFPLTRAMVAIERGAFGPGIARAYAMFTVVDSVFPVASAVFFVLLWAWLMARAPHRHFESLVGGGLFILPLAAAACDLAENIGFVTLVFSDPRDPLFDVTTFTLVVHSAKYMLVNIDNFVTLVLIAMALFFRVTKRTA